jgi:hypothetical protein
MKKLLTWAFLGLSLLVMSCQDVATNQIPELRTAENPLGLYGVKSSSVDTHTIDSLRGMLAEYQRIETTQNGVCDSCVTGYTSALIEYRTISKELNDRTHDLRVKLDAVKMLNSNAYSLVSQFQRQSSELENIVSLRANLIQENNKQVAELRKSKSDLTSSKALIDKARY